MHKSRLAAFVIDSRVADLGEAARFWSGALGYAVRPSDPAWAERYAYLESPGQEPMLLLQKVEHDSRIHLDIETDDIPAEVARLSALGATVVKELERWTVMEAPIGHRFCVVRPQRGDFAESDEVNTWE